MTNKFLQRIFCFHHRAMLLLFFCCFLFRDGTSQSNKKDGLTLAQEVPSDSVQADQLNALSKKYWTKNLDSSVYYAQKALKLSQKLAYTKGVAEAYRNIGVTNMFIGDKMVSKQYLLQALALFQVLPLKKDLAATYNNLGALCTEISEFSAASNYFDSALTLFREMGNKEGEGSVLNYIGINYQQQGNYQKAIDYCLQGFEIRKEIKDHQGVVFSLINVGNMYLNVGQPETALNFYNQSVSYAKNHDMEPFNYSLNQIGKTYLKLKQYDTAEAYLVRMTDGRVMQANDHVATGELYAETGRLDKAIREFNISLDATPATAKAIRASALVGLSKVFLKKGEHGLAMSYATQAYELVDSFRNKLVLADAANILAQLYKANKQYKEAIQFFELAHSISDSVSGENYQRKLAFTASKNEIENEQARVKLLSAEHGLQAQKLEQEQFLKKLILGVFAAAVYLSVVIIRNINGKRKKIQSQKDHIEIQSAKVENAYEELKSTQAQLIQKEKMASLGELTAGIAHEIQNPLNFVNNFSQVNRELILEMNQELREGNNDEAITIGKTIEENEEKIFHHGNRADAIVKGMLQHSKTSLGQEEATNINKLADEYLRLAYHGFMAKDKSFSENMPLANATVKTDFDDSIDSINIIPQDIGRVLLNMYNNAFYAVAEKEKLQPEGYEPTVSVSTKKLKDKVEISIQDNGNGIQQHIIDKIFQPFFTTKPTGQGTGLGLSLSYDIIKAHGGEIKVETKGGGGSEFIIQLPA
ncbi:MAG: tetratricopeptide repeat protein [Ginsengibacter sp.]